MVPEYDNSHDFLYWLKGVSLTLQPDVELVPLSAADPWQYTGEDYSRPDKKHHRVVGLHVKHIPRQRVKRYKFPVFADEKCAQVGVVVDAMTGDYLIRARADPGNVGYTLPGKVNSRVLLSPPLRYLKGELEEHRRAKNGDLEAQIATLADLLADDRMSAVWEPAPQNGGRFFEKVISVGLIKVEHRALVERHLSGDPHADEFVWVTNELMTELCRAGLVNDLLRQCLSVRS